MSDSDCPSSPMLDYVGLGQIMSETGESPYSVVVIEIQS